MKNSHAWVSEVLEDLKTYASANNLLRLSRAIEQAENEFLDDLVDLPNTSLTHANPEPQPPYLRTQVPYLFLVEMGLVSEAQKRTFSE